MGLQVKVDLINIKMHVNPPPPQEFLFYKWIYKTLGLFYDKYNVKIIHLMVSSVCTEGVDQSGNVPFVVQIIQRTKQRKAQKLSIRADLYRVELYSYC